VGTGGIGSAVCSTRTTDKLHERVSAPYGIGVVMRTEEIWRLVDLLLP
jgi:hypothetical protein